ncbi:GNAT family N-acetyltransferase [Niveibacterium sp. 24ML]|uniref:GNAT family N-acetyltransferase n=1 Tax=Niveibacterium sp. 24ML TaxID=2985512 RepID=UPI002271CF2A|nr:GNAT family N-acetyltransferase [Niveibacterium sp. 24ML]MCX9157472.1 GNAT family N-acetyltransferase [Niveibacterium sp. 24ML]
MVTVADLRIVPADPGEPAIRDLIAELDALMHWLYPAESNHLLDVDALRKPNVRFFAAQLAGDVVGCGAYLACSDYAEIKRMFVAPRCRGLGIARRMLATLEADAVAAGLPFARLETGIHQPEALGLYERAGYCYRPPFGDYAEDPLSVFMEKPLAVAEP